MEEQRYPVNVRLIGVMKKEKSKLYMTSVLWSDQNDIIVYRTFKDFKRLHKQMKKIFPPENPLKKSDRIIPIFRDRNSRKTGSSKSVVYLKYLERYCNELLSCDPRVPQCNELIQFFHPKDRDLQPDFAKNSIVIMPSDDISVADKNVNVGKVTQPFLTETYRCVAPYETKDTNNRPFKVTMDEKLDVLIKDNAGWWLVENVDKHIAWFPAPYLEKIDEEEEDEKKGLNGETVLYSAVRKHTATNADEVSVDIGSVVEILQKTNNGWWLIRYKGKVGYIPSMYLQPYNNPLVCLEALQKNISSSSLNLANLHISGSSKSLAANSLRLSRSQGNLTELPGSQPNTPNQLMPTNTSHSLNVPSECRPSSPAVIVTPPAPSHLSKSSSASNLMLEVEEELHKRKRSLTGGSLCSFGSEGSDFNGLSPTSCSSSLNLRCGDMDKYLRQARTPPPMVADRISFDSDMLDGRLFHSRSENNLLKMPASTPKVPPRPKPQEILTRCTTVTRKNASKARLSCEPAEVTRQ
ncbi:hypothetical protein UPYG_G00103340 [Umbra pygmaea]|uniref:NADPH oxidase organizer 1 n=1 Tax=Umbra pygmaea TaxID=75934 RepID=A0ABD0XJ30_UMBPY